MKNKILNTIILVLLVLLLTGCGNDTSLTCTVEETMNGRPTKSELVAKIKDETIEDMQLTMTIELPGNQVANKQTLMNQLRQKTRQVYSTNDGVKAIFDMNSEYFSTLGITPDVSYSELKQVLEIQGYTCK